MDKRIQKFRFGIRESCRQKSVARSIMYSSIEEGGLHLKREGSWRNNGKFHSCATLSSTLLISTPTYTYSTCVSLVLRRGDNAVQVDHLGLLPEHDDRIIARHHTRPPRQGPGRFRVGHDKVPLVQDLRDDGLENQRGVEPSRAFLINSQSAYCTFLFKVT